jgi:F-type H+-transporting ATPase subunit delta
MAEPSTLARPYAEAVFRLADAAGRLQEWSDMLANMAKVATEPAVESAMGDPNLSGIQRAGLFIRILEGQLNAEAENLLRVLAENRRLELLPEIALQFEVLKNEREGIVEAQVISAFPMENAQLGELVMRLEKRTGKRVKPHLSVDQDLIAGVRVVIGDKVYDASVRAQLAALEAALKS